MVVVILLSAKETEHLRTIEKLNRVGDKTSHIEKRAMDKQIEHHEARPSLVLVKRIQVKTARKASGIGKSRNH